MAHVHRLVSIIRQLTVLVSVLLVVRGAAAGDAIPPEARQHFRNGVELIQGESPSYQDAYNQFKLAYEKSGSWKVLGNLGLCALKLERDGEAREHYTKYLEEGNKAIDPEERAAIERDLLFIDSSAAKLRLTSSETEAELVDQRAGSSAPPQSYAMTQGSLDLVLRAGTHTITATTPDAKRVVVEIVLSPGDESDHHLDFDQPSPEPAAHAPDSGVPAAGGVADSGASSSSGSGLRTVGFVAAGVGAAALIGGAITGIMARGKESAATDQCDANKVCDPGAETDFDSADSLAGITNVLLIGGGVLAATGVTLILVGGGSKKDQAGQTGRTLRVAPALGLGGAGVLATGAF